MRKKRYSSDFIMKRRFSILFYFSLLLFFLLIIKAFFVMIIDNKKYSLKLENLSYSTVSMNQAPRGRILDRNYNVIVDNIAIKTIIYKKEKSTNLEDMVSLAYLVSSHVDLDLSKLNDDILKDFFLIQYSDICNDKINDSEWELLKQRKLSNNDIISLKKERITENDLNKFNDQDKKASYLYYLMNKGYSYEEKVIKSNASDLEYAYIAENMESLPGFSIKLDWERTYPYGDTLKSILGTVSTSSQGIPREEKAYYLNLGYSLNDRVGLSYLEKQYENYLQGEKDIYEVYNSHQLNLIKEGRRGKDIVLSIDINLQKEVERILSEEIIRAKKEPNTEYYDHSSVIIEDPNTGEILAIASKKIVNGNIIDNITSILASPITPGSVVKGASMLVGYNTGVIKMGEYILDECIKVAGAPQKCSYKTLGLINDITALAKSSNVYQFKTAIRVNGQEYFRDMKLNFNQNAFDIYRNMYHSFGLGVKTGIDLPIESTGYTAKDTSSGNLLDYVMGQYETYTPIQLLQYVATIANGGERLEPHLLKEVKDGVVDSTIVFENSKKVLNKVDINSEYMNRVKEGFYAVMHSSGGYGVGYIDQKLDAAGKTGTSQSFLDTNNDGIIDTETITSSFVGYAPSSNPKFAIVVTSPDSSHPYGYSDYASLVTLRITKAVTNKYYEMFGL